MIVPQMFVPQNITSFQFVPPAYTASRQVSTPGSIILPNHNPEFSRFRKQPVKQTTPRSAKPAHECLKGGSVPPGQELAYLRPRSVLKADGPRSANVPSSQWPVSFRLTPPGDRSPKYSRIYRSSQSHDWP